MTATEANRNFTAATRLAEKSGVVGIEKKGKRRYVLMTTEKFEEMKPAGYIGRRGEEICKIEPEGGKICLYQILVSAGEFVTFCLYKFSKEAVEIRLKGNSVIAKVDYDDMKKSEETRRFSSILYEGFLWDDPEEGAGESTFAALKNVRRIVKEAESAPEDMAEMDLQVMLPTFSGEIANKMDPFN